MTTIFNHLMKHVNGFTQLSILALFVITAPAQFMTAPAHLVTAPAQLMTAPARLITAPAQPPATGVAVYTALFKIINFFNWK